MRLKFSSVFGWLIVILVFSSCGNRYIHHGKKINESHDILPGNLWFDASQKKALYKINIEAFHQKQGGILMVRKEKESALRLSMITEFGLKVFDVEYFRGDSTRIHYIMKHLDNPYIIHALFDNLKVLWPNIILDKKGSYFHNEKKDEYITCLGNGLEQWYYFQNAQEKMQKIIRLENGHKRADFQIDMLNRVIELKTKRPSISIRLKKIKYAKE